MYRCIISVNVLFLVFLVFCQLPEDPRTIGNAGIGRETLTALPDSVPVNTVYQCTLTVLYPEFVDSFAVYTSINSGAAVKVAGTALPDDTIAVFPLHLPEAGSYVVSLLVYKSDMVDSVVRVMTVFATTPILSVVSSHIIATIDHDAEVKFNVTDPDSNLLGYTVRLGTAVIDERQFFAGERANATIRKELPSAFLKSLHDTLNRFSATVTDADGQVSAAALCTLIVRDTTHPNIVLLPPHTDSVRTVTKLPDTIRAIVRDNWSVDSVVYGGRRVAFANGDTVRIVVAKLDSGKSVDTLEARDPAGNIKRQFVAFLYSGPKVYPPKVTPFYQTVNEGGRFDTVYLDSKVTITDSAASYGKDSLVWSMVVDSIDSGMAVVLNPIARIMTVTGPSGELFHNRMSTVSLTVTDPAGLSATLHGVSFIMVEKDDPPKITLAGQGKLFNAAFDTLKLDTCGSDPEKNAQLVWSITRGKYFIPEFEMVKRCTGLLLEKEKSRLPVCREVSTGKVVIRPDSVALASVPSNLDLLDTLLFSLKSIATGDTAEVFKKVPFSWGRAKIFIPVEIPQFIKP